MPCSICHRPGIEGTCPVCQAWQKEQSSQPRHQGNSTVQYFEGSAFIGQREMYCYGTRVGGGPSLSAYWPHTAFFCPVCGEIWGRAIYQHSFDYQPIPQDSWVIESRRCVKHGDGLFLSTQLLESCSHPLLRRELLALLENLKP